jgi:hypothetical protein
MPTKQYVSVAVKKEMLNTLSKLDPNKPLKALVTEAIIEYISNKTIRVTNKTSDVGLLKVDVAPSTGGLNNQYTFRH